MSQSQQEFSRVAFAAPDTAKPTDGRVESARGWIYAAVAERLERLARADAQRDRVQTAVWSHGVPIPQPQVEISAERGYLRVRWADLGISASLLVRIGDVRIGFMLARRNACGPDVFETVFPYPEGTVSPRRTVRPLGDTDWLVDFMFYGDRLGAPDLTRAALCSDVQSMELLADALYQETVHLLAALVHQMAHAGVLLGHQAQGDTRAVHFSLRQDPEGIRQILGLTPAELLSAGDGVIPGTRQWTALVPEARLAAFEAQLQDLSHAEFLDRQRTAGEFKLGELWLRASPGVYHPAPGSSTQFMLDALRSQPDFLQQGGFPGGSRILDLGCGTGALALWVKASNPSLCVLGSDIDPEAVINARANAEANGLDVAWAQGDLLDDFPSLAPWDAAYDCILWNYPFWQGRPHGDPIDHIALDENGHLLRRFFGQLPRWLVPGGKVFLSYSTLADVQLLFDLCECHQLFPEKIAEDAGAAAYQRQVWKLTAKRT